MQLEQNQPEAYSKRVLQDYGLTANEISVYLKALELGTSSPYKLAQSTAIPRTTIYDIITDLALKGLLELETSDGYTKQQTIIRPKNPSVLRKLLRQKREESYKLEANLIEILPSLRTNFHKHKTSGNFAYYPGVEGARQVYEIEAQLTGIEEVKVFTLLMPMDAIGSKAVNELIDQSNEAVRRSGLRPKEIIPLNNWTRHILSYQYGRNPDYFKLREFRYLDDPVFEQFMRLSIVGDKVIGVSTEESEIWGFVFTSKVLAKTLASIFHVVWRTAKPVTTELIESFGPNPLVPLVRN